jgi:hypothetical protein
MSDRFVTNIEDTGRSVAEAVQLARQARKMLGESARILRNANILYHEAKALKGVADILVPFEGAIEIHWASIREDWRARAQNETATLAGTE